MFYRTKKEYFSILNSNIIPLIFLIIVVFFTNTNITKAYSAECHYTVKEQSELFVQVSLANGSNIPTIKLYGDYSQYASAGINNIITKKDHFNNADGSIKCPDLWYVSKIEGRAWIYNFSGKKDSVYTKALEYNASKSTVVNDKQDPDDEKPVDNSNLCNYGTDILTFDNDSLKLQTSKSSNIIYDFTITDIKNLGYKCPANLCLLCSTGTCRAALSNDKLSGKGQCFPVVKSADPDNGENKGPGVVPPIQYDKVTCDSFKAVTKPVWFIIRIAAPILTIILGGLDFVRAVAASDEKEIKKSTDTFIKRLIILAAILILPVIVNLIVGLIQFGDLTGCL